MFRTTAALTMCFCVSAIPARAADTQSEPPPLFAKLLVPPSLVGSAAVPVQASRGAALPSLYVGLAAFEVYDGVTTTAGIHRGATEANRVLGGAAANGPALWALKGG